MPVSVPAEPDASSQEDGAEAFRRVSLSALTESAAAFFENLDIVAETVGHQVEEARSVEAELGATIGFVSDHARGTLTLVPDSHLIARSHPLVKGDDVQAEHAADWVGEMANQIMGRCKNRLLPYGVTLLCDTPISVSGKVRLGNRKRRATAVQMRCGDDNMRLWWDVDVDPDIVLGTGEAAREEGELCLF